jgi:hypothetical protein
VDNYATTHNIGENFRKVLKYGRHRGVNLVMIARRPVEINPLLRSQATRYIIFPMGADDAAVMKPHIGEEAFATLLELRKTEAGSEYLDFSLVDRKCEKKQIAYVDSHGKKADSGNQQ